MKRTHPLPQLASGLVLGIVLGMGVFQSSLLRRDPAERSPVMAQVNPLGADGCVTNSDCTVRPLGCIAGIIVLQQSMCQLPPGICATTPGGSTYGCVNGQCVVKGDCSGTYYMDFTCNNECGASSSTTSSTAFSSSDMSSSTPSSAPISSSEASSEPQSSSEGSSSSQRCCSGNTCG